LGVCTSLESLSAPPKLETGTGNAETKRDMNRTGQDDCGQRPEEGISARASRLRNGNLTGGTGGGGTESSAWIQIQLSFVY